MKIAVLGGGNGGMTMAAHVALMGHEVRIFDKYPQVLEGFAGKRQILLDGALGRDIAKLAIVSTALAEVVSDADMVMVVTPAFAHKDLAQKLAPLLKKDTIIVLHPGRTGGALEFSQIFHSLASGVCPPIVEAQTLLYACRRTGLEEVMVYGVKRRVDFAVLPASSTSMVAKKLCSLFSQFVPVANVLETSLLNVGAIFHPAPTILNSAWIEMTKGNFEHYRQGISPSVALVLEKIDEERIGIAGALGVHTITTVQWLQDVYGITEGNLYSAIQANKVYSGIKAASSLDTRYISEDVPMSLVPLAHLGKLAGVGTPTMDAIIKLACVIHKTDYRIEGRTLEKMGLDHCPVSELGNFVA
ncbi:MAG: NAD/NADP octopine/nopaline dehydrogenase family protein [Spirochaetota bacterium]